MFYKMMLKSPCFYATYDSGFSIYTNSLSGFGLPEISGFATYANIVCLSKRYQRKCISSFMVIKKDFCHMLKGHLNGIRYLMWIT